nr:uncharacterized protein LOC104110278 [Nicotiana tomentosiformis]
MTELKQALSGASNNANERAPIPPSVPVNQTSQRTDNNIPKYDVGFDEVGGTDSFIKAHSAHSRERKVQAGKEDIFRIYQGESELLREFATIWEDVHNRYESKIRIEDDQLGSSVSFKGQDQRFSRGHFLPYERTNGNSSKGFQSSDRFAFNRRTDRGRNNRSLQEKEVPGSRDPVYPRLSDYNFNISLIELVLAIWNIKEARFPKLIRSDPSQRDHNLWCEFHGTHGHRTRDCRHLHKEVATFLNNGHLREFLSDHTKNNYGRSRDNMKPSKTAAWSPWMTINMIFGGSKVNGVAFTTTNKTNISVTHRKRVREVSEYDITFTKEDVDGLLLPHNDTLVISLNVLDFQIKHVLVDPGTLANIIQWRVLEQAKLTGNIIPAINLLVGFNLICVTTRGKILLHRHAE